MCYFLLLLAMHIGTIIFTVSVLPQALDWISLTEFPMHAGSVNGEACAMVICMLIQATVRASISPLRSTLLGLSLFLQQYSVSVLLSPGRLFNT